MAKRKTSDERNIEAENSYIEGSVNVENGDVILGDKFIGNSSRDFIELIEAIKKNLMPKYLNPDLFAETLEKFKNYHQELYEWKELHNDLDEILNKFNQFYSQVHRLNNSIIKPSLRNSKVVNDLRLLWYPTSQEIDDLLVFSKKIKLIGIPFQEIDGQFKGEQWAIDFFFLRSDMEVILYPNRIPAAHITVFPSWQDLYNLTEIFYNKAFTRLHWGDKKLRETATELFHLSETVFQR